MSPTNCWILWQYHSRSFGLQTTRWVSKGMMFGWVDVWGIHLTIIQRGAVRAATCLQSVWLTKHRGTPHALWLSNLDIERDREQHHGLAWSVFLPLPLLMISQGQNNPWMFFNRNKSIWPSLFLWSLRAEINFHYFFHIRSRDLPLIILLGKTEKPSFLFNKEHKLISRDDFRNDDFFLD